MFKISMTMLAGLALFGLSAQTAPNGTWQVELASPAQAHGPSGAPRAPDRGRFGHGGKRSPDTLTRRRPGANRAKD